MERGARELLCAPGRSPRVPGQAIPAPHAARRGVDRLRGVVALDALVSNEIAARVPKSAEVFRGGRERARKRCRRRR